MRWFLRAALAAVVAAGCAETRPAARSEPSAQLARSDSPPPAPQDSSWSAAPATADQPAPLDPEVAALPNAQGHWMIEPEYGGVYVVSVGPAGAPAGPPLILVHGLGTNGIRDFYPVLGPLAAHRRIIMLDLPGFGRSGRANAKYAPDRYAAVLSRVIAAYGPGPVDVVGHSMGGAISLYHAAAYPEQVRRLIVVDAAGILHRDAWFGHHMRRVTDPTRLVLPRVADKLGEIADFITDTSRIFDPAPDLVLEFAPLRQRILGGKPERIAALGLILTDFSEVLSRVRAPTLIVWGADDMVAPLRTGLMLSDRLPDAQLVVFPGVGHQVMAQAPALLVPQIERHLAGTAPPVVATPAAPSQGKGLCNGQSDLQLTGVYDSVVIEDCPRVTLDQVHTSTLVIRRSTASIVRSTFSAGIVADASTLIVTGGEIGGEVAVDVKDSKVDLAGVLIAASREPFRATGASRVLLSVCPVRTAGGLGYRHGFVNVPPAP